ncbi:MAG: SH3 domain-containing protein, partial [Anaerolineae bacterium]|nr:SH3 domain-containing protein [Anaerolineae bacterium]
MSQNQHFQAGHGWRLIALLGLLLFSASCGTAAPAEEETITTGAPTVQISSPLSGDVYREGVGVNILVRVENAGADLARVAIQVDGEIVGEAVQPDLGSAQTITIRNGWPATGVGGHVITAVASRADGTSSEPASVSISVVANDVVSAEEEATQAPTQAAAPTDAPTQQAAGQGDQSSQQVQPTTAAPTDTLAPTDPPAPTATATPANPQIRVTTGANVRSGPGVNFEPPIGSLAAGATADILAVHTSGTWYKIQYYNGDGWISSAVVEVTGDIAGLPREAGP